MKNPLAFRFPLCAVALCAALGGCTALGPDYAPETPLHPPSWSTPLPDAPNAGGEPLADWWQSFGDPVLDRLAGLALAHNQDLGIAHQRLLQARAERDQVASRLGPELGAGADASASRSARALDYPPGIGESRSYRLGLDASWEIDLFGGRRRAAEAAQAQAQAVEEDEHALRVSLMAEVAASYATLRATQERVLIARDNIASLAAAQHLAETACRHGLGTTVEVSQARAERELGEARVPALRGDEARLIHALGVLAGGFPGDLKEILEAGPPTPMGAPALPAGVPSEMLRNRPDILAAERRLAAASAQIGVAEAERFPKFVIPLSLGSAASLVHDLFSDASIAWSIGAGASQSLYDGGRTRAGVRAALAHAQAQRLAYEQSVRRAFQDVEDALAGLNAQRSRQAALAAAVRDSQTALDRSTRLYRNGLSGYLSVLTAQRATYQARDALALSRLAHVQHVIGLYKALGAGWQAPPARADSRGRDAAVAMQP